MPRIVYVAAALTTTAHALRQTNAARLTLFGDGCGFRAAASASACFRFRRSSTLPAMLFTTLGPAPARLGGRQWR